MFWPWPAWLWSQPHRTFSNRYCGHSLLFVLNPSRAPSNSQALLIHAPKAQIGVLTLMSCFLSCLFLQGGSATSDGMLTTDVGVERVLGFAARMQNQLNSLLGVIGSSVVSDGGPGSPRVAGDVQPSTNAEAKQQEGGQGSPSVAAGSSVKTEARQHEEQISGTDSPGASGSGAGSGGIDSSLPASSNTTVLQRISLPAGQSAQITPDVGKTYVSHFQCLRCLPLC